MGSMTMAEIRQRNKELGHHFFERDTVRFFKSHVYPTVYGDGYFVTRETNPSGETKYSVRKAMADGSIKTVGEFHSYRHIDDARDEAKRLSRTSANPGVGRGRRNPGTHQIGVRVIDGHGVKGRVLIDIPYSTPVFVYPNGQQRLSPEVLAALRVQHPGATALLNGEVAKSNPRRSSKMATGKTARFHAWKAKQSPKWHRIFNKEKKRIKKFGYGTNPRRRPSKYRRNGKSFTVEVWRKPTKGEVKFGYGTLHRKTITVKKAPKIGQRFKIDGVLWRYG